MREDINVSTIDDSSTNNQYKPYSLRHWYLGEYDWREEKVELIYGTFYNRPGFFDGENGHTSIVQSIKINKAEKEYEIQTKNNLYHCSFDSLLFERQDKSPYSLPEYEDIKAEYYKPVDTKNLSEDDMLLVVSDYCDYYFERLIYQNDDGSEGEYYGSPHIGMFTDTYLISNPHYEYDDTEEHLDIRYYVFNSAFEFYSLKIGDKKNLWIENRGERKLQISGCGSIIDLKPGERILAWKKKKSRIDNGYEN